MENLKGKQALVTGGNSGIGYATARLFKERGAEVIITGRRKDAVEAAANELQVTGIIADQASIADSVRLADQVSKQSGGLDILFINAGIVRPFTIEGAEEQVFNEVMDINFKGAYFTLSKLIPVLNDGASVIFLSSIVSRIQSPGSSIYSASKAALNAVMRTAALELAPRRIRVNAVSPGPIKTPIMGKAGIEKDTLKR